MKYSLGGRRALRETERRRCSSLNSSLPRFVTRSAAPMATAHLEMEEGSAKPEDASSAMVPYSAGRGGCPGVELGRETREEVVESVGEDEGEGAGCVGSKRGAVEKSCGPGLREGFERG